MSESRDKLMGIWQLMSCDIEYRGSGTRESLLGAGPPSGYLILAPEGRLMALIVGGEREPAQTDDEQAKLFRTMLAYSGPYRLEGDQLITMVDVSWNQAWTGTEQVRFYTLEGDRLDMVTAWMPHPARSNDELIRGVLCWKRSSLTGSQVPPRPVNKGTPAEPAT